MSEYKEHIIFWQLWLLQPFEEWQWTPPLCNPAFQTNTSISIFTKDFICLSECLHNREREETETFCPLKYSNLGQAEARSFILVSHISPGPQALEPSCTDFPDRLESWARSGTARIGVHMGPGITDNNLICCCEQSRGQWLACAWAMPEEMQCHESRSWSPKADCFICSWDARFQTVMTSAVTLSKTFYVCQVVKLHSLFSLSSGFLIHDFFDKSLWDLCDSTHWWSFLTRFFNPVPRFVSSNLLPRNVQTLMTCCLTASAPLHP